MTESEAINLVCIGGGTGLSSLLSGVKQFTSKKENGSQIIDMNRLSAIVSVSDDGGSTGRLIEEFDVLPPGDIRKLLVSLSETNKLFSGLFEHRFDSDGDLSGHTVGNLMLIALIEQNNKSFPKAIQAASKLLEVRAKIVPVSLSRTTLCAELIDGEIIRGESNIPKRKNREAIRSVFVEPRENGNGEPSDPECIAHTEATSAIENADAIVIGPGSLYTSIMPNLVFPEIADALKNSDAIKIYICNVMSQPGETDGYSVSDHVEAIQDQVDIEFDYVIANRGIAPDHVIQNYVKKELVGQFSRIRQYVDEGVEMLERDSRRATKLMGDLTKHIIQVSDEIQKMSDASSVQVLYDPEADKLGKTEVIEADMVRDVIIREHGVELNVIRHNPEKLASVLVDVLNRSDRKN